MGERRLLVVELVGAPGAGKTTVVPLVADALAAAGRRALLLPEAGRYIVLRTRLGRLASIAPRALDRPLTWRVYVFHRSVHAGYQLARRPRLLRHLWRTQRHRPSSADARLRRVTGWFVRALGARSVLEHLGDAGEVAIFDEGLVHRVVQLHSSSVERPDSAQVRAYLDCLPAPDLVLHVQARPSVCHERIQQRGRWPRLAHRSEADIASFVTNAHHATELLVAEARRRGWLVVDLPNEDGTVDCLTHTVREAIDCIVDGAVEEGAGR